MANARDRIEDAKPYVRRAIQDEELRDNLRSAFATARDVYDELIANRGLTGAATKVASDKDIQDQLRSAIQDLRDAADRIQGNQDHKGRNSTLLLAGIALGILFNPLTGPETRRWLKDQIFGEDEEVGYGGSGNGNKTKLAGPATRVPRVVTERSEQVLVGAAGGARSDRALERARVEPAGL